MSASAAQQTSALEWTDAVSLFSDRSHSARMRGLFAQRPLHFTEHALSHPPPTTARDSG
jgi:hypothetical protein